METPVFVPAALPPVCDEPVWPYLCSLLPADLEESARRFEALRRCRNVPDAAALLRLALAYAVTDLSLKDVAAWAHAAGVAEITGPGLFYRLRTAQDWLGVVLAQTLQTQVRPAPAGLRLRAVDATVVNGPGATGTEWRAHVLIDPATGCFRAVELTDAHGGEGYARHPFQVGDVVLGDRAYGTARGVYAVHTAGAQVLVRLNPHAVRLCGAQRQRWDWSTAAAQVPHVGAHEWPVQVPVPPAARSRSHKPWSLAQAVAWLPARLVGGQTRAREVIWLLTTLPAAAAAPRRVLELYRLRWQIELLFKRLKSLLHLDQLPARQGPTAKSWMLARFLAAALAQQLLDPAGTLSPWGYALRPGELYPERLVAFSHDPLGHAGGDSG